MVAVSSVGALKFSDWTTKNRTNSLAQHHPGQLRHTTHCACGQSVSCSLWWLSKRESLIRSARSRVLASCPHTQQKDRFWKVFLQVENGDRPNSIGLLMGQRSKKRFENGKLEFKIDKPNVLIINFRQLDKIVWSEVYEIGIDMLYKLCITVILLPTFKKVVSEVVSQRLLVSLTSERGKTLGLFSKLRISMRFLIKIAPEIRFISRKSRSLVARS